ncbi:MAG: hypothetical protein V4671_10905 [Armatimonadota bacterium]
MIPSRSAADTTALIRFPEAHACWKRWRTSTAALVRAAIGPVALLLLIGGFFALYINTVTSFHSFDSVAYALNIRRFEETGRAGWLFHPHHLLFNGLVWICHDILVRFAGPQVTTLDALQIFTCGLGALGIGLFALWIFDETRSQWTSGLAALALGTTWGWWFASTDGRANVAATALLPLVLLTLSRTVRKPNQRPVATLMYAALSGAALALVCLLHESHLLFLPIALGAAFLPRASLKARVQRIAAFTAAFAVTFILPYVLVLMLVKKAVTVSAAHAWLLAYARQDTWWSFTLRENLFHDARALWKLLTGQDLAFRNTLISIGGPSSLLSLLLWMTLGAVSGYGWGRRAACETHTRPFAVPVSVAGLVLYVAFFTIWDPGYYVFWFAQGLFLITLLAIGWKHAVSSTSGKALLLVLVLALAGINYAAAIKPRQDSAQNPHLGLARSLFPFAEPRGLLLATGAGMAAETEVYVPYFARLQVLALHQALAEAGGNSEVAFASVQRTLEKVLKRDDPVFLLSEVITPGEGQRALAKRYGITPNQIEALFQTYRHRRVAAYQEIVIYELSQASPKRQFPVTAVPQAAQKRSLLSRGDRHRTQASVLPVEIPHEGQNSTARPVRQETPHRRQERPSRPPMNDSVPPRARHAPPTTVQSGPGPR